MMICAVTMTTYPDASAKATRLNQENLKLSRRATSNFKPATTERRKASRLRLAKRKRHVWSRTVRWKRCGCMKRCSRKKSKRRNVKRNWKKSVRSASNCSQTLSIVKVPQPWSKGEEETVILTSMWYQKLTKCPMEIVAYRERRSLKEGAAVPLAIEGAVEGVVDDAANVAEAVVFPHASNLIANHVGES